MADGEPDTDSIKRRILTHMNSVRISRKCQRTGLIRVLGSSRFPHPLFAASRQDITSICVHSATGEHRFEQYDHFSCSRHYAPELCRASPATTCYLERSAFPAHRDVACINASGRYLTCARAHVQTTKGSWFCKYRRIVSRGLCSWIARRPRSRFAHQSPHSHGQRRAWEMA